jgi:putative ABC transport system substrate-binding protein
MRRREFIKMIGGAAAASSNPWTLAAHAQQPVMPVIGFLNGGSPTGYTAMVAAFRLGLQEQGFIEGRNVKIEYHWANGQFDKLPALASDLVRRQVGVIAGTSTAGGLAAKAATTTIPVVFTTSGDPVHLKLVASLSRPGGNVTGATQLDVEVSPKRLELLHELFPTAITMALLVNPTNPTAENQARELVAPARALGLQLHVLYASTEHDLDAAFASFAQLHAGGLVISSADSFFTSQAKYLAALAVRYNVPAIYQYPEFTAAGGLISYGGSITATYRLAGVYVGRILKGEKPADLPVQQATKIELIINLKAAKALGITVPPALIARADEVIE